MSDPTAQAKSSYAQSKGMQKSAKSKFSRGKAVSAKAASFNKAVGIHLLVFWLVGLILGCTVFLPFFSLPGYPLASYTYAGIALLSIFIGVWSQKRASKKIDWYTGVGFLPKFWLTLGVFGVLFLGITLLYSCISYFTGLAEVPLAITALIASASMTCLIPLLFRTGFERAMAIEPKHYRLWEYPENYIERQPTWNRERIVFANLHFKRKESENLVTTVKVKLPKEAIVGELIYLFMRDFNENRSPDNPIQQLSAREGVQGWMFKVNNTGLRALFKKKRLVDTDSTIEENNIEEDQHLYFERLLN